VTGTVTLTDFVLGTDTIFVESTSTVTADSQAVVGGNLEVTLSSGAMIVLQGITTPLSAPELATLVTTEAPGTTASV